MVKQRLYEANSLSNLDENQNSLKSLCSLKVFAEGREEGKTLGKQQQEKGGLFCSLGRGQGKGTLGQVALDWVPGRHRHNQTHSNLLCPSSVTGASEHLRQKVPFRQEQVSVDTRANPRATRPVSQELQLLVESSNFA